MAKQDDKGAKAPELPTNPFVYDTAGDTALAIDGALAIVEQFLLLDDQHLWIDRAALEHGVLHVITGARAAVKHLGYMVEPGDVTKLEVRDEV